MGPSGDAGWKPSQTGSSAEGVGVHQPLGTWKEPTDASNRATGCVVKTSS